MKKLNLILVLLFCVAYSYGATIYNSFPTFGGLPPSGYARSTNGVLKEAVVNNVYPASYFGCVGDGEVLNGCFTTNGSATIYAPNASFTAFDIGKVVLVYGTNTSQPCFQSRIAAVPSSVRITITNTAPQTLNNCQLMYGTGDGAALQFCADQFTNGNPVIEFEEEKIYVLETPVSGTNNAQIQVPNSLSSSNAYAILNWRGTRRFPGGNFGRLQSPNTPYLVKGGAPIIWSTIPRGPDGTNNPWKVFTTRRTDGTANFSWCGISFQDLNFRGAYDNNMVMVDLYRAWVVNLDRFYVDYGFAQGSQPYPLCTGTNGSAIVLPQGYNNCEVHLQSVWVWGGYNGIELNGNVHGYDTKVMSAVYAFKFGSGAGNNNLYGTLIQECSNAVNALTYSAQLTGDFWCDNTLIASNRQFTFLAGGDGTISAGDITVRIGNVVNNGNYQLDDVPVRNTGLLTDRVRMVQLRPQYPPYQFTKHRFADDVKFDHLILGEMGTVNCLPVGMNTAGTPANAAFTGGWDAQIPNGVSLPTSDWRYIYFNQIPLTSGLWTNKPKITVTFNLAWTNAGVVCLQAGFRKYTRTAANQYYYSFFATNAVAGNNITTISVTTTNSPALASSDVAIEPVVIGAGNLGPNVLFSGSFAQTNTVWVLNAQFSTEGSSEYNSPPPL